MLIDDQSRLLQVVRKWTIVDEQTKWDCIYVSEASSVIRDSQKV